MSDNKNNVVSLADARKAKAAQTEEAELELCGPQAIKLQGDDWQVTACDGEQVYVWIARKTSEGYTITEVYPGLAKEQTTLRDAKEPVDLELDLESPLETMADVLEDLEEIIIDEYVEDDDGEAENT